MDTAASQSHTVASSEVETRRVITRQSAAFAPYYTFATGTKIDSASLNTLSGFHFASLMSPIRNQRNDDLRDGAPGGTGRKQNDVTKQRDPRQKLIHGFFDRFLRPKTQSIFAPPSLAASTAPSRVSIPEHRTPLSTLGRYLMLYVRECYHSMSLAKMRANRL